MSEHIVLIDLPTAAKALNIGRERLRQLIRQGYLRGYQLEGWPKTFLERDQVAEYEARREAGKG